MNTPSPLPVLIVDDDPTIRLCLHMVVRNLGYSSIHASSGEEALSLIQPNAFSLILLDQFMPGLCGLGLFKRLRNQRSWNPIPIIVISGHVDQEIRTEAFRLGALAFLQKPFETKSLKHLIKQCLSSSEDDGFLSIAA
jgi:two-component system, NtrC family, C4-dicarboxylate transport response regulator DctD